MDGMSAGRNEGCARAVFAGRTPVGQVPVHWETMNGTLFDGMEPAGKDAGTGAGGWFVAHCDGGSRGNPGPAGYGAVIEDPRGQVAARLSEFLGKQTNNYAEYAGLLAVLQWANENGVKQLRVLSDSELMVNQMKGRYKVGSPGLRPLWEEAKQRAGRLEKFQITHTLRGGNKDADKLANEAMDRGMGKSSQSASLRDGEATRPGAPAKPGRQVFEGLVKGGVVHLIEGELPDGILVKVVRE
jgi:probable phosphoglycerate mutase